MDPNCKICNKHHYAVPLLIYQDDRWIIRHSDLLINCPGYLYVEPKEHIIDFNDFSKKKLLGDLGRLYKIGIDWIFSNFKPLKIYTVNISEVVQHIHFHLIPRYSDELKGLDYIKKILTSDLPMMSEENVQKILKLFP